MTRFARNYVSHEVGCVLVAIDCEVGGCISALVGNKASAAGNINKKAAKAVWASSKSTSASSFRRQFEQSWIAWKQKELIPIIVWFSFAAVAICCKQQKISKFVCGANSNWVEYTSNWSWRCSNQLANYRRNLRLLIKSICFLLCDFRSLVNCSFVLRFFVFLFWHYLLACYVTKRRKRASSIIVQQSNFAILVMQFFLRCISQL